MAGFVQIIEFQTSRRDEVEALGREIVIGWMMAGRPRRSVARSSRTGTVPTTT
jgi:hypothetical protein